MYSSKVESLPVEATLSVAACTTVRFMSIILMLISRVLTIYEGKNSLEQSALFLSGQNISLYIKYDDLENSIS